jgi:hypothetical protein
MGIRLCVLMLTMSPLTVTLRAQAAPDLKAAGKMFLDSTAKQRLILKGFSADPNVEYRWTGNKLVMQTPSVHTFGVFEAETVKDKKGVLELAGRRRTLLINNNTSAVSLETPIVLRIDLAGADPVEVLSQLKSQLFYASYDEALVAVPTMYKKLIPYSDPGFTRHPYGVKEVLSDEAQAKQAIERCPAAPSTFTPPKILHHPDLVVTQEAARARYRGDIVVAVTFLETGKIGDPWLAMSAGYGLDEVTVDSTTKLRFKPATCNGAAVPFPTAVITHIELR